MRFAPLNAKLPTPERVRRTDVEHYIGTAVCERLIQKTEKAKTDPEAAHIIDLLDLDIAHYGRHLSFLRWRADNDPTLTPEENP